MSILDRFREAVFRLIMISALTKVSTTTPNTTSTSTSTYNSSQLQSPLRLSSRSTSSKSSPAVTSRHQRYYSRDSHDHSEAVADCIEFIKRSANEDSLTTTSYVINQNHIFN
ncbi:hypothetical protein QVD17_05016 [Tagetes erecta]|uniref:Josephin-like protein n=1 Tax=Tagetes erecta TaxID=13708 RepID=A0AAD8P515_TARER|nr:hypothetical protein QVD17_05016 [Tagetes erecta]